MGLFNRNGKGSNGDGELVQAEFVRPHAIAALPPAPEPHDEYSGEDLVWRCKCGSMGTSRDSMTTHVLRTRCGFEDIREYVPREVYKEEYERYEEAQAAELSLSGIWIVVKMSEYTEEGSVNSNYESKVMEARDGLKAIQGWYTEQIGELSPSDSEVERNKANGRYVAIDFFTGHRYEAKITSEWRANVEVAEGSHA